MTSSTPVRAIKTRGRSRTEQTAARRAIEPAPAPVAAATQTMTAPRPGVSAEATQLAPKIGKAEKQLAVSFLMTAAIVFSFTVLLPFVLRLVRNF